MPVKEHLERILQSTPLASSPSLCRFLRYIVEETMAGRASDIKEYPLGVHVFDRGEDFNPRMDPIVRVQARNLRVRLERYYQGPGMNDTIRIELPKGTYVPIFHGLTEEAPLAETAKTVEESAAVPEPYGAEPNGAEPVSVEAGPVAGSVMPMPPPRSPVVESKEAKTARVMLAALVLVVILAGIAVLWISRTYAGSRALDADAMAQDLLIRGRYSMDRPTEVALRSSIAVLEQATARAPRFAQAYAALADAYNMLAQYGYSAPLDAMEKARTAARKSLELNPRLAEGHVALAAVLEAYDWKWAEAEREYRKALELSPGLPEAHLWYGMFLRDQGRMKEGLPQMRRAAQLAPQSVETAINLAYGLLWEGAAAAGLEQAKRAVEMAPEYPGALLALTDAARACHDRNQADAALAKAVKISEGNPHATAIVAMELAAMQRPEESRKKQEELLAMSQQRYVSPYDLARVSLVLGDGDQALNLFEEAYRQRSSGLIFLRHTNTRAVRDVQRLHSLIEKMHFQG